MTIQEALSLAALSPPYPPNVATAGQFSDRTTTRELVTCVVLSTILHGIFVWMFRLPSGEVAPERVNVSYDGGQPHQERCPQ